MPHELFLTTRQKTKTRNALKYKRLSNDIKLSEAQISKTIQSGGFLCGMLGSLAKAFCKEKLINIAVPFANYILPGLYFQI